MHFFALHSWRSTYDLSLLGSPSLITNSAGHAKKCLFHNKQKASSSFTLKAVYVCNEKKDLKRIARELGKRARASRRLDPRLVDPMALPATPDGWVGNKRVPVFATRVAYREPAEEGRHAGTVEGIPRRPVCLPWPAFTIL